MLLATASAAFIPRRRPGESLDDFDRLLSRQTCPWVVSVCSPSLACRPMRSRDPAICSRHATLVNLGLPFRRALGLDASFSCAKM